MQRESVHILLVEDNPADAKLTRKMLERASVTSTVHVVEDGVEALAFLRRQDEFADSPRPDLILLDLNLPRKDGREVLGELKRDTRLHTIPVVVMTTSSADEDVLRSYQLHANAYITKPVKLEAFLEIIGALEGFWLKIARLPPRD